MRVASAFGTPARADARGFENPYGRQSAETRASGIFDGSGRREARTRKRRAPDGGATHRARRGCSRRLESGRDARGFTTACGECREDAGGDGENPFPGWHNDRVRIFSSRDFLRLATPGERTRSTAIDVTCLGDGEIHESKIPGKKRRVNLPSSPLPGSRRRTPRRAVSLTHALRRREAHKGHNRHGSRASSPHWTLSPSFAPPDRASVGLHCPGRAPLGVLP